MCAPTTVTSRLKKYLRATSMYTPYFDPHYQTVLVLDSGFHYHLLDLLDCMISLPENIPFRQKFPKCLTCIFITRCVSWLCLLIQKKVCVRISPSYFNSVYWIARKQTDSFCPTPLTCIGVTFRLTPATVDNTLRHRAPDRISCQQLGVWTVVYGTLCSRGNQPQMCVCANAEGRVCEGLVWLVWCVFMRWFSMLS